MCLYGSTRATTNNKKSLNLLLYRIMAEVKTRIQLSDSMLLQTASAGRALQGILLTKRSVDQIQVRSCLIEAPENVVMSGTSLYDEKDLHFYSAQEEKEYKKSVDVLGLSIAAADVPVNVALLLVLVDPQAIKL